MLGLGLKLPKINTGPFNFRPVLSAPEKQAGTFRAFVQRVNPTLLRYAHVRKLVAVLQRVADGEIRRLMVFEPPRHFKSETVSRLFSAYYLLRYPTRWVGLNSYAAQLAYTLSRNARDNFKRAGGELNPDKTGVEHWETSAGGGLWAAGVGGPITGKGFHLGIIDDPVKNSEEAASETIREKHKDWYRSTFSTREEPISAVVVIQTRWHDDDLSGWLLRQEVDEDMEPEHWHIVCMPALMEPLPPFPASCTVEPDERQPGEALCPERYDVAKLERRKQRLAEFWDALYQQRPVAPGGGLFRHLWWSLAEQRNRFALDDRMISNKVLRRWLFVDSAFKDKDSNDYSACVTFELWPDYRIALRSVWQERILAAFLPQKLEELALRANADGKLGGLIVEDRGSGTTAIQTLRATAPAWLAEMTFEFEPTGTKEMRARQASIWAARDCIQFPYPSEQAPWYFDFIDDENGQLFRFPNAAHDDMVDAFTMGILFLEHYISQGWHARLGTSPQSAQRSNQWQHG